VVNPGPADARTALDASISLDATSVGQPDAVVGQPDAISSAGLDATELSSDAGALDAAVSGLDAQVPGPDGQIADAASPAMDAAVADGGVVSVDAGPGAGGVTTFAGAGMAGSMDGPVATAQFNQPAGIAVTASGVVYVTERNVNRIRRIENGVVSTIVPSGEAMADPVGIGVTDLGVMFVADASRNCVVRIEASGVATAWAGTCGQRGALDGMGTAARFARLRLSKLQADGTLWVADSGNYAIRRIDPSGLVTTPIGTLTENGFSSGPLPGNLYFTWSVLVTANATYVTGSDQCVRVAANGMLDTLAGVCANVGNTGAADGLGAAASFNEPRDMVELGGVIYLVDSSNHLIRAVTAAGSVTTITGGIGDANGDLATARFSSPIGIAAGPDGALYVTDTGNNRVRRIEL